MCQRLKNKIHLYLSNQFNSMESIPRDVEYKVLNFIRKKIKEDWPFEKAVSLGTDQTVSEIIENLEYFCDVKIDEEQWRYLVKSSIALNKQKIHFEKEVEEHTVSQPHIRFPDAKVNDENGYWRDYRKVLESKLDPVSIENIRGISFNILKRLSPRSDEPIRGLVFGSVQSGKTANMEALITMAADNGFNIFIILTGMISSLNDQNQDRFHRDLNQGTHSFQFLTGYSNERINPSLKYVFIDMKTNRALKQVIKMLNSDPKNADKYKILIIDDESDYASVDSSSEKERRVGEKRSTTNEWLMRIVNSKNQKGQKIKHNFGCLNYVGFTATPYSNLLNECDVDKNGERTLYPGNFIVSIPMSNHYFGPQQIFGVPTDQAQYEGMPILNVTNDLDHDFKKLEKGESGDIPEDLRESVSWFICAVAALRFHGFKGPLSMMVNTSSNVDPHKNVAKAITEFINQGYEEIGDYLKVVYDNQCSKFPKSRLRECYPNYYGTIEEYEEHDAEILNYPAYDEIEPYITEILSTPAGHIRKVDKEYHYNNGIHICIENGTHDTVEDEPGAYSRLKYPEKDSDAPDAPAFLVVGGNVLSRGLTLEGLVSSFFFRNTKQADSLMQMGRWFGYRPGYELFPRIWLSSDSEKDFTYLAELDESLRGEIRECNRKNLSPDRCAIRLLSIPKAARLRGMLKSLTSKNKRKAEIPSSVSYIGQYEEYCIFRNDEKKLGDNKQHTVGFLNTLTEMGYGPQYPTENGKGPVEDWNVIRWSDVPHSVILESFLDKFEVGLEQTDSTYLLKEWLRNLKPGILDNWTVLLAGVNNPKNGKHFPEGSEFSVGMIQRSKEKRKSDIIQFKTLRSKGDLFRDVFPDEFKDKSTLRRIRSGDVDQDLRVLERSQQGLDNTPLMIIYCIDKDSKATIPKNGKEQRKVDLDSYDDVVTFLVEIPNVDTRNEDMVQIKLDPAKLTENEKDDS